MLRKSRLAFLASFCLAATAPQQEEKERDTEPVLIHEVDPDTPEEAEEAGTSGEVVLEIQVETDGTTTILEVIESLEYGCTEAAVKAAEQWKWKPALLDGEPVEAKGIFTIHFELQKE